MTWIAAVALGGIILALLMSPAFEVRLGREVVTPVLVAALLMALGLILGNAVAYAGDVDAIQVLGIISGIVTGLGLFFVVLACARFAMSPRAGAARGAQPASPPTEDRT